MPRQSEIKSVGLVTYHRNGSGGEPFWVVLFDYEEHLGAIKQMMGIVFAEPGHVAVFERSDVTAGSLQFGFGSWRGDTFEVELRTAIKKHDEE